MGQKENDFLARAPKWREKDIEALNAIFDSYIFRREKTGEVWTTCCRKHEKLPPDHPIWLEEHVSEWKPPIWGCHAGMLSTPPRPKKAACPFCGRIGKVKDIRYTGRRKNLWQARRAVVLRQYRGALWALAAWLVKDYESLDNLAGAPHVQSGAAYRFGKTAVEYVTCHWCYGYEHYHKINYAKYRGREVGKLDEPFSYSNDYGMGYSVVGLDELAGTAVRYCMAGEYARHHSGFVRFLLAAHAYPRQVEMLMKADMENVVFDLAERGVRHVRVLDWGQTDMRRAFKVPPEAVKEFMRLTNPLSRHIGILETWKDLNREDARFAMADAVKAWEIEQTERGTLKRTAAEYGLPVRKLWRYIERTGLRPGQAWIAWKDYVRIAAELEYPLHRENVLLPRDLGGAHDAAARERTKQLKHIRRKREERARLEREKAYAPLYEKLKKLYEIDAGPYIIRVPASEAEIVAEGKALQHCVGGYASRHAEGKTVILFLRDAGRPEKPYITIEMDGQKLRQIHGFKNEGYYTAGGRFAPDPRETFRWLLDPWIDWIRRGSKRNKDGSPRGLHFEKEAKTA